MSDPVLATLKEDEGYRDKAYKCSAGIWTIGYGTNLQTLKIDKELAEKLLLDHYAKVQEDCASDFSFFHKLDPVRQGVLVSMVYQMGLVGVKGFKMFLEALSEGRYEEAAEQMLNSKWARIDSPQRAKRHAERVRSGVW